MNAFHWRRAPSVTLASIKPSPKARSNRGAEKRPVSQLTLEGALVAEFPSIAEAARRMAMSSTAIHRVCNGIRNTSGGFRWKYQSREEQILRNRHGGAYSLAGERK